MEQPTRTRNSLGALAALCGAVALIVALYLKFPAPADPLPMRRTLDPQTRDWLLTLMCYAIACGTLGLARASLAARDHPALPLAAGALALLALVTVPDPNGRMIALWLAVAAGLYLGGVWFERRRRGGFRRSG